MPNQFTEIYQNRPQLTQIYNQLRNQTIHELESDLPMFSAVIAEELAKKISPTQLRRFYTYVKAIDRKNLNQQDDAVILDMAKLKFLLPKLAGSVEKKSQEGISVLHRVFAECLHGNRIEKVKDLRLFMEFFEAILDYHATFKPERNND
jgi:CRISPR type III-A-associated protein Csm2